MHKQFGYISAWIQPICCSVVCFRRHLWTGSYLAGAVLFTYIGPHWCCQTHHCVLLPLLCNSSCYGTTTTDVSSLKYWELLPAYFVTQFVCELVSNGICCDRVSKILSSYQPLSRCKHLLWQTMKTGSTLFLR